MEQSRGASALSRARPRCGRPAQWRGPRVRSVLLQTVPARTIHHAFPGS
ncbi:hypothetical protein BRADI_3g36883v3 [Brachypodium distachyon]|uniref:Uncharacterized protein n=1 Tax=Brachypodium distachyon TaxID=15368 RepID=A0A2K2D1N1_BRADI|nr:hypothetical protein BRADI_3g36883v3 [Brachypodium distachyon]